MIFGLSFPITEQAIRHLHIFHNAPYLPPKILHNLCFSFLLGITTVPREIENNLESGATTVIISRLFHLSIMNIYLTKQHNVC